MQLHAVARLHLEGDIVAGGGMYMVIVVAVADIDALGDHLSGDGDAGGVIVLVPLCDVLSDDDEEENKEDDKEYHEEDGDDGKAEIEEREW